MNHHRAKNPELLMRTRILLPTALVALLLPEVVILRRVILHPVRATSLTAEVGAEGGAVDEIAADGHVEIRGNANDHQNHGKVDGEEVPVVAATVAAIAAAGVAAQVLRQIKVKSGRTKRSSLTRILTRIRSKQKLLLAI